MSDRADRLYILPGTLHALSRISGRHGPQEGSTEYVRGDIYAAVVSERDALRAEARGSVCGYVPPLDGTECLGWMPNHGWLVVYWSGGRWDSEASMSMMGKKVAPTVFRSLPPDPV